MRYQPFVVAALLLFGLLVVSPIGTADLALGLVIALAALVLVGRRVLVGSLLHRPGRVGPTADERHLRGKFRRQHRPDTPGKPRSRAPGSPVGALSS